MDVSDAINGRRAVRQYTTDPVGRETVLQLIDAAVHAPSAVNQQPWTFTVVRDAALLDRISAAAKQHMLASVPESGLPARLREELADPHFQIFHHAPLLILISALAPGPWIVEDCALAAENLMLAAHAKGLGTCWIGFAQDYLGTAEGKRVLGLPQAWVPIAPIIVGRPATVPPPVPRRAPEVRWIG